MHSTRIWQGRAAKGANSSQHLECRLGDKKLAGWGYSQTANLQEEKDLAFLKLLSCGRTSTYLAARRAIRIVAVLEKIIHVDIAIPKRRVGTRAAQIRLYSTKCLTLAYRTSVPNLSHPSADEAGKIVKKKILRKMLKALELKGCLALSRTVHHTYGGRRPAQSIEIGVHS